MKSDVRSSEYEYVKGETKRWCELCDKKEEKEGYLIGGSYVFVCMECGEDRVKKLRDAECGEDIEF